MSDVIQPPVDVLPPLDYWHESRQPLTSLAFITPLLVIYEVGVLLPSGGAARNGVDVWLRMLLDWIGFGQYFLLPALTVCILLAWHHTTHQPWRIHRGVLGRMAVECLVLAIFLRLILQLQTALWRSMVLPVEQVASTLSLSISDQLGTLIMFLGAGIYEELLFRLILLSGTIWLLKQTGLTQLWSTIYAVVLTSILFSAAHYVGTYGESFDLSSFLIRFVAGVFFCVLYVGRGFGIAAGAHAGYDILVGLFPRY